MSKINEKRLRKGLGMIRSMAVQSIMFVWLIASSFMIFLYMASRFFPDIIMLLVVGLAGGLTVISGYLIRRMELAVKQVWDAR